MSVAWHSMLPPGLSIGPIVAQEMIVWFEGAWTARWFLNCSTLKAVDLLRALLWMLMRGCFTGPILVAVKSNAPRWTEAVPERVCMSVERAQVVGQQESLWMWQLAICIGRVPLLMMFAGVKWMAPVFRAGLRLFWLLVSITHLTLLLGVQVVAVSL